MVADRVEDGLVVTFAATESDLRTTLEESVKEYITKPSGKIDTPQIKNLLFLATRALQNFRDQLIAPETYKAAGNTMLLLRTLTDCMQFMLSALHALDSHRACERPIRTCSVFLDHVQNLQIHAVRAKFY